MKKKILVFLALVLVLVIAFVGAAVLYANSYVQSHKAEIQQQISSALGAPVSFSDAHVQVVPSIEISVDDFVINDSQGGRSGVSVKALRAQAKLIPLFSKQVIIKSIRLVEPTVYFVQTGSGLAVKGLPQGNTPKAAPSPTPAAAQSPVPSPQSSPFTLSVERILVENGTVTLPSRQNQNALSVTGITADAAVMLSGSTIQIPTIEATARLNGAHPLSLTAKDFAFSLSESVLRAPSILISGDSGAVQGSAVLQIASQEGQIVASSDSINLSTLASNIKDAAPVFAALKPSGRASFSAKATLRSNLAPLIDASVTPKDVGVTLSGGEQVTKLSGLVKATGASDNLTVSTQALSFSYQNAPLKLDAALVVSPKGVDVTTLNIQGFGGQISLPAKLTQGKPGTLTVQPSAASIQLEPLMLAVKPALAQSFGGTLNSLTATVASQTGDQMASSLKADGAVFLTNGVLKGSNLPMQVLNKLAAIPVFSGLLTGGLPDKYKSHVSAKDTAIRELNGNFSYAGGQTTLKGVKVVSDMCSFTLDGTISNEGDLRLSSTFTFSPDISMGLVKSFKGLNRALNEAQQLVVPVMIQGRSPMIVVLPDVTKLLTGTITNIPGEALGIVGGLLGMGPSNSGKEKESGKNGSGRNKNILGF